MSSNYWFLSCYIGERTLSDTVNQYVVPGVVHTTQTIGMRQPFTETERVFSLPVQQAVVQHPSLSFSSIGYYYCPFSLSHMVSSFMFPHQCVPWVVFSNEL